LLLRAASIEVGMGRVDAARERIRVFQAVDPGAVQGALKRADIEMRSGNLAAAVAALEAAHRLNPAWAETKRTLAWIVAADPLQRFDDLDRVARLAEEAVDSTRRRDVIALMTLGAVRARQARFDDAIAAADEALELNDLVEIVPPGLLYQQRDAYAARRPYSDPRLAGQ
jgi:tetratricopeptide (TPR) repeat protein